MLKTLTKFMVRYIMKVYNKADSVWTVNNASCQILRDYGYKGKMRLEYCTSDQSQFPVRILSRQLYKHDPTPIIFGQILLTGEF